MKAKTKTKILYTNVPCTENTAFCLATILQPQLKYESDSEKKLAAQNIYKQLISILKKELQNPISRWVKDMNKQFICLSIHISHIHEK